MLVLHATALSAICVALLSRSGAWSWSYRALVGVSLLTLGLAVLELVGRGPIRNRPTFRRPSARALLAIAPWIAVIVLVFARDLWWTQQDWRVRLFAAYLLLAWSAFMARPASAAEPDAESRGPRVFLTVVAFVAVLVAVNGVAFGTWPFGVKLSAVIG